MEGVKDLPVHAGDDDILHAVSHSIELQNPSPGMDSQELEKHLILTYEQIKKKKLIMLDTTSLTAPRNGIPGAGLEQSLSGVADGLSSTTPEAQTAESLIRELSNAQAPAGN